MYKQLLCLFALVLGLCFAAREPLLYVPGAGTSALEFKIDEDALLPPWCESWRGIGWFHAFYNPAMSITPQGLQSCLFAVAYQDMKEDGTRKNKKGVEIRPRFFGGGTNASIAWCDTCGTTVFSALGPAISAEFPTVAEQAGYVLGDDFRILSYDWRWNPVRWMSMKDPVDGEKYKDKIKALIEDMHAQSGTKVALGCFSMGAHLCHAFLTTTWSGNSFKNWKTQHISRVIYAGASLGGIAAEALFDTLMTSYIAPPDPGYPSINVPVEIFSIMDVQDKRVIGTVTPNAWGTTIPVYTSQGRNYTAAWSDIKDFFNAFPPSAFLRKQIIDQRIDPDWADVHPGVPTTCISGSDMPTIEGLDYPFGLSVPLAFTPLMSNDGDSFIPARGQMTLCQAWSQQAGTPPVNIVRIPGMGHLDMLQNAVLLETMFTMLGAHYP